MTQWQQRFGECRLLGHLPHFLYLFGWVKYCLELNYLKIFLKDFLHGSGTLGLLIPPSIILIIYGVTVQESIAKLFIAGIFPGIMIAIIFMTYVVIWSLMNKNKMPILNEQIPFIEKIKKSGKLIPEIL